MNEATRRGRVRVVYERGPNARPAAKMDFLKRSIGAELCSTFDWRIAPLRAAKRKFARSSQSADEARKTTRLSPQPIATVDGNLPTATQQLRARAGLV